MARRAYPTTFEERVAILERATAGQPDPQIAAALHCRVGLSANGGALANARVEAVWPHRSVDHQVGRWARFPLRSVLLFSSSVAPIPAGAPLRVWPNCAPIRFGRRIHSPVAPGVPPSSNTPNCRAAIAVTPNYPNLGHQLQAHHTPNGNWTPKGQCWWIILGRSAWST